MFWWRKKNPSYERAMDWCRACTVPGQGVIKHTRQPLAYAEVTGHYVPTLYQWGQTEPARNHTRWLMSIHLPDGAVPAPDAVPYTFDTARIMRGLFLDACRPTLLSEGRQVGPAPAEAARA